jgi:hypothetical protein
MHRSTRYVGPQGREEFREDPPVYRHDGGGDMGNVVIDMSMSLDGYIAAPNDIRSRASARTG